MRNQLWYVAVLVGLMCLIRFGMAAAGYLEPIWLMEQLGAAPESNLQMPYIIRVWAIRDMVVAVLVIFSGNATIRPLLLACIAIDSTDILSAHLSGAAGLFNAADTWNLKLTAIPALVLEVLALALISLRLKQSAGATNPAG